MNTEAIRGAPSWHIHPDAETLARHLACAIVRMADAAIAARGAFHLVLAGGNTPQPVYAALISRGRRWDAWHLYHGDERCLPPQSPQRNSRMAASVWLQQVPIPRAQIHDIPAEMGAEAAAAAYTAVLPPQRFDLVLLGIGEDGHTASLFPGQPWGLDPGTPAVLAVHNAPKAPAERVSLSAWRLQRSREIFFLAAGSGKRDALAAWRRGEDLPAARVGAGAAVWLDEAAWPGF